MTIDVIIAEGPKRVVDNVVALGEFDLMEKTASKPFDIGLRFKVRAVRKASANHRPSFLDFFSGRKFNISCPPYIENHSWLSFLQFFTNGGHCRIPIIAWRHASDMASPRRHQIGINIIAARRKRALGPKVLCFLWFFSDQAYMTFVFLLLFFFSTALGISASSRGGSVTSVSRILDTPALTLPL